MPGAPIFVSRLLRLPLLAADGVAIGGLDDVVIVASGLGHAPRLLGLVAVVERRHIFVNAHRLSDIGADGARLRGGSVDLRRFEKRQGELLARVDILDKRIDSAIVNDIALVPAGTGLGGWEISSLSVSAGGLLRRRGLRMVAWSDLPSLFDTGPLGRQVAELRELHPADVAAAVARLPLLRRQQVAEAMDDERLADLLEEMPEEEQVKLIEGLDLERVADVLEEMEPDDAADLLAELPPAEGRQLLEAMEPDDANRLRRLLIYRSNTAGGLMTPEPVILAADATVAEALARVRERQLPAAIAAHVFVVEPPTETPTGRYLGPIGFQRLLREPPSTRLADCLDDGPAAIHPEIAESDVARLLAAYDVVAVPVCDHAGRLVGAVTVDDVLDHVLPEDWRRRRR